MAQKVLLDRKKEAKKPFLKRWIFLHFHGFDPTMQLQGMFRKNKDWDKPVCTKPVSTKAVAGHVPKVKQDGLSNVNPSLPFFVY